MCELTINFDQVEKAISVMREVSAWGRKQGYRVWPDEWLTKIVVFGISGWTPDWRRILSGRSICPQAIKSWIFRIIPTVGQWLYTSWRYSG